MSDNLNFRRGDILLIRYDPKDHPTRINSLRESVKHFWEDRFRDAGVRVYFLPNDLTLEKISFGEQPKEIQKEVDGWEGKEGETFRVLTVGEDWVDANDTPKSNQG